MQAGGADASSIERIPLVSAGAEPLVLFPGRPATERATDARRFRSAGLLLFFKLAVWNNDRAVSDQMRLTKRAIRHYPKTDEFCLAHEEVQRVTEYIADQELAEAALKSEMQSAVAGARAPSGTSAPDPSVVAHRLRRIIDKCLFDRAESFASAVRAGDMKEFATDHLDKIVIDDLRQSPAVKGTAETDPAWLGAIAREVLSEPGEAIQAFLRDLADAYTVLAFLRHTPDVQSAVEKIFSYGQIWLDTSVILPLLAEELFEEHEGRFQQMCRVARQAGIEFFVTSGVGEELDRHIERAIFCSQKSNNWEGDYPFLFEAFLQMGRSPVEFQGWAEMFRGPNRPLGDLLEFLEERFGINGAWKREPLRLTSSFVKQYKRSGLAFTTNGGPNPARPQTQLP